MAKTRTMKLNFTEARNAGHALQRLEPTVIAGIPGEPGSKEWAYNVLDQALTAYNTGVRTYVTPEDFRRALEVSNA